MNWFELFVVAPQKNLRSLRAWLGKARAYATERKFDPNVLLQSRLAPDQFALVRQVQSACDTAKLTAGRLAGKEIPSHPDTETTLDQLEARVDSVLAYLDTFTPADFAGADDRTIAAGWMQGKHATAHDYALHFAIPNFFFHLTHTYAILRHNGVPLGKMDFIGGMTLRD